MGAIPAGSAEKIITVEMLNEYHEQLIQILANIASVAQEFDEETAYTAGTYVYHDGILYRYLTAHAAGTWDAAEAEEVTVGSALANNNRLMTLYAQNIADIEMTAEEAIEKSTITMESAQTAMETVEKIDRYMEFLGRKEINYPNLLSQKWWTYNTYVEHNIVFGRDSRFSGSSCPYLMSYNDSTLYELDEAPTAEQLAEASAYWQGTDDDGNPFYRLYKDEDDIRATVAELAEADQITEIDGETYDKAIEFAITANSAYGNAEWLRYNRAYWPTATYKQGETPPKAYDQLEFMEPGKKYTMSFWGRCLEGTGAIVCFGWGGGFYNNAFFRTKTDNNGASDWIEVSGSEWKRYYWTFTFSPVGEWYTETSEEIPAQEATDTTPATEAYTQITRKYNWPKSVAFGIGRKYTATVQLCGFRMTEGSLYHNTEYDEIIEKIENLTQRVSDLEAELIESENNGN